MSRTVTNKVGWVSTVYDILGILSIICAVAMLVLGVIHHTNHGGAFAGGAIGLVISGVIFFATSAIIRTFGDIEVNTQTSAQDQKAMGILMLEVSKNLELVAARLDEMNKASEEIDKHLCAGINWFGENLPKLINNSS